MSLFFQHHPQFEPNLSAFIAKHCNGKASSEETLRDHQNLLSKHFMGNLQYTSKHIGLAEGFGGHPVYWLHMVIPNGGLSRTQHPKCYFYYRQNSLLSFLCLDSHTQNYKDSKLRDLAKERLNDMLEVIKSLG